MMMCPLMWHSYIGPHVTQCPCMVCGVDAPTIQCPKLASVSCQHYIVDAIVNSHVAFKVRHYGIELSVPTGLLSVVEFKLF